MILRSGKQTKMAESDPLRQLQSLILRMEERNVQREKERQVQNETFQNQLQTMILGMEEISKRRVQEETSPPFDLIVDMEPKTYAGEEDQLILDYWIQEFDKMFRYFNYPAEHRVNAAVYYFEGEADIWWKTRKDALQAEPDFGWDSLKVALKRRFFPDHRRIQNDPAFPKLKQLSMSVKEYYDRSLELFQRTPYITVDEATKARLFVGGLNLSLQKDLCGYTISTVHEAYEKASIMREFELMEQQEQLEQKRMEFQNRNKRKFTPWRGNNFQNQGPSKRFRPRYDRMQRFNGDKNSISRPYNQNQF